MDVKIGFVPERPFRGSLRENTQSVVFWFRIIDELKTHSDHRFLEGFIHGKSNSKSLAHSTHSTMYSINQPQPVSWILAPNVLQIRYLFALHSQAQW